MMEWATPAALVHYLINNRAGLPPWDTRIDWVALALDQWDLVSLTSLPLTREFVEKEYIPKALWRDIKGLSHLTDPLFINITHRRLKELARPENIPPLPFTQEHPTLCTEPANCPDGTTHTVFKNEYANKLIPKKREIITAESLPSLFQQYTQRFINPRQSAQPDLADLLSNQQLKRTTKYTRKGRRALKKERDAIAAAATAAGPSTSTTTATASTPAAASGTANTATCNDGETPATFEKDDIDVCTSDRLLDISDLMEDMIQRMRTILNC